MIQSRLEKIPNIEFESLVWKRGGNISSALLEATGARIEDGKLIVEEI